MYSPRSIFKPPVAFNIGKNGLKGVKMLLAKNIDDPRATAEAIYMKTKQFPNINLIKIMERKK
jgi:hypothetical protein